MIYKLYALPTRETIEYFDQVFQGSPLLIDPTIFGVELGSSRTPVEAREDQIYRAIPGLMKTWYDSNTSRSYWLLPLFPSPEMVARHQEIGDAWDRQFVPFLMIAEVQNRRHHNVAWMNSVATGMASTHPILEFHNEVVTSDMSIAPDQNDFYEDYMARGQIDNTMFATLAGQSGDWNAD
jgi:hypothetical protein